MGRLTVLVLTAFLGCSSPDPDCRGWQYNNPNVTLREIEKTCSDPKHELALDGQQLVCVCRSN